MHEKKLPDNHLLAIVRRKDAKAFRAKLGELFVITREWNNQVCRDGEILWDGSELCATYEELFAASPEVAKCKELVTCRPQFAEVLHECHTTMFSWQGCVVGEAVQRKWVEVRREVKISCGPLLSNPALSPLTWKPGVGFAPESSLKRFLKIMSEGHKKEGRSLKDIFEAVIKNNRLTLAGNPTEENMAKAVLVDIRGLCHVLHHLPVYFSTGIVNTGSMIRGVEREKALLIVEEELSVCAIASGGCPSECIGKNELVRLSSEGLYPLDFVRKIGLALRPIDPACDQRTWSRTSLAREIDVGKGIVGDAIKACGFSLSKGKKSHAMTRDHMIKVVRQIHSAAVAEKVRQACHAFAQKNQFEIEN